MTDKSFALLMDRGLIAVEGEDAPTFLQGLVSNDVERVGVDRAVHAAFLTPQGKYLHDFFIIGIDGALVLECENERRDDLIERLSAYKLRSKVTLGAVAGEYVIAALFGDGALEALGLPQEEGRAVPFGGGVAYVDPRLAAAGARAVILRKRFVNVLQRHDFKAVPPADYETLRLSLGLPDGSRDMVVEKSILLENGFDELNGVDWDKGCFLGQELTARTKYRGLIKKRLMPVAIDGPLPAPGTPVMLDGKEVGEMRTGHQAIGLAMIRLEHLEKAAGAGADFTAGEARLTPRKPDWAAF